METKQIVCPCCGKTVDIPLHEYSRGFDFNYSILINSYTEFFNLVDICPECGYTMLFDNGISDEMKEYVNSDIYRNILLDKELDEGLKKWILVAVMSEFDENYTEAGIEYMKAYDYLELKGMDLNKRFIKKAASCFLRAAGEYTSFIDAILAVDCLRRDEDYDRARSFLKTTKETFQGELVDKLTQKEELWLDLRVTEKRYLDI